MRYTILREAPKTSRCANKDIALRKSLSLEFGVIDLLDNLTLNLKKTLTKIQYIR